MNFDDIKSSYQSLSFEGGDSASIDFTRKVEGAVEKVRNEDRRDKRLLVAVSILFVALAIIYTILGVLKYLDSPEGSSWWGYGFYVLAILSALPVYRYKYRKISRSDYDAPVIQFIDDVEKKFAFFPKEYALAIIPFIILADISIVYMFADGKPLTIQSILIAQIPLVGGLGIGLIIGAVLWFSRKLPILEELRRIKKSIG